jgi:hypothetical protein
MLKLVKLQLSLVAKCCEMRKLYCSPTKLICKFCINFYYIVESEILRNTQWHIFHIFTSEDIDHVTFSIYTIFCWDYIINRTLHGGLKIWLLSSRASVLKTIFYSLAALVRIKYCFDHSKIKVISSRRRVISSMYITHGKMHHFRSKFGIPIFEHLPEFECMLTIGKRTPLWVQSASFRYGVVKCFSHSISK